LVELGVIPYDLNDKYQQSNDDGEVQELASEVSIQSQTPITRPRSVVNTTETSLLKPTPLKAAPEQPESVAAASVAIDYWAQCSAQFITDLKVVFPEVKLSVPAFDALVAQLSEHVFWKVEPKLQAQYVQMESIEQVSVITSPLPSELTLSQKKELWLLLQPYAPQPAQTIREN
jgi:hypothetical protein